MSKKGVLVLRTGVRSAPHSLQESNDKGPLAGTTSTSFSHLGHRLMIIMRTPLSCRHVEDRPTPTTTPFMTRERVVEDRTIRDEGDEITHEATVS
jgi:hypothetical protein